MSSQIIDNDYNFPIHLFYKGWYVILEWETKGFWDNIQILASFHIPIEGLANIYAYATAYEKDLSKLYRGTQPHLMNPGWYHHYHSIDSYSWAYEYAKSVASNIASTKKQPIKYRFEIGGTIFKKMSLSGSAEAKDEAILKVENYIERNLGDIWAEFRSKVGNIW